MLFIKISTLSLTLAEQSESEGLERAAVLEARIATRLTALDRVTVPIPVAPTIATTVAPPPTIIVQKEAQTTSAAESPEILTSRAERYLRGQGGLRQCATTAAQLVRRAVRQARSDGATYAPAWFLLGTLYLAGDGLAKDIVAGAQCVFRAAGVSDGSGGTTIQVDPAMGANGMSAAPSQVPLPGPAPGASGVTAEKVYPSPSLDALTLLAEWYTTGYLVRQSAAHAVQLYLTAARAGHAPAMLGLAQLASERPLAAEWYEAAAKRGSGRAARELGHFAASPSVTPVNDEDPPSQGVLAEDVAHSQDLPDWDRAAHWYTLAATLGDTDGMCALGACYEAGLGVSQCWVTAAHWYAASARRGSTSALANLGYIYWRQSKYVSAWNAWTLASQRSPPSPDALIHMACVYRDGCEWQPTAADVRALLVAHSSRQEPQDVFKGNGSAEPVWVIPDGSDDLLLPFVITQSYELAVSHCLKAAKLGHEPARALLDELIQLSSQASPL
ncbi:hypothetical protein BC828DRAFT_371750 [Blastocladiella britannica]|nr:hypothetical protein BC828DRAFT_371750 [Blastocladiella britannica]